jgi:hypothetical protein
MLCTFGCPEVHGVIEVHRCRCGSSRGVGGIAHSAVRNAVENNIKFLDGFVKEIRVDSLALPGERGIISTETRISTRMCSLSWWLSSCTYSFS